MTNKIPKKYLFFHYADLSNVSFKEIIKPYHKVYAFIDPSQTQIPYEVVMESHRLKATFEWVEAPTKELRSSVGFLAFFLGKIHTKTKKNVIFHIHSGLDEIDALAAYLQSIGRQCQFLWHDLKSEDAEEHPYTVSKGWEPPVDDIEYALSEPSILGVESTLTKELLDLEIDEEEVTFDGELEQTASETVKMLLKSGNRPSRVEMLKNYIVSYSKNSKVREQAELVIKKMHDRKSIEIQENGVIYNF